MKGSEELIKQWIELADHNLGTAKLIHTHIPEYREVIGFHCQQAVEKYLKALLTSLEIEFGKTHDLIYLIDIINDKSELISYQLKERTRVLSAFAVNIRYPMGKYDLKLEDIKPLIEITEEFRKEILKLLNLPL